MRRLLLLLAICGAVAPAEEAARPLLRAYCAGCHGGDAPAGGFALGPLLEGSEEESLAHRAAWEKAALRLRAGEMPPAGAPRPIADEVRRATDWVESSYEQLDRSQPIEPGRVTARRLNRVEYANSVRDLLGVDMNVEAALPPDPYGYGFDSIGDVLSMNAALTEQYLKAAERVAAAAVPLDEDPPPPTTTRYLAERMGQERQMRLRIDHAFPADGVYRLRTAFYQALKDGARVRLRIAVDGVEAGAGELKFYYQIDRGIDTPGIFVTAGKHRIDAKIEVLPEPQYNGAPPYLEYVQVSGPVETAPAGATAAYARFFACGHAPGRHEARECARRVLGPLARRAFRRPVTAGEADALLGVVAREQARGAAFEQAMRTALTAVLVSPQFLYRVEQDPEGRQARPLREHELAARLSYFLWSSLPDEELERLADAGRLSAELDSQARRMLADPKAEALVENFTGQWLQTRNLEVLRPDAELFPEFTGELAEAMRTETRMLFGAVLRGDRPVFELLTAGYTFLNERLARHYGLEGVSGEEFRRVELDGVRRGGVLTHASVLTVSSYPTRTSPVIRGKWILDNILNEPPPPPPPDVPALEEAAGALAGTMRQQLEAHRANAACAACHRRMDPLGFGLENYDAIGRWRDMDGEAPIDASGELPGGLRFETPAELRAIVAGNRDAFARALAEKLLTYATGRGMEIADRAAVRRVADRAAESGYSLRSLVLAVTESETFRMRSAPLQSAGER